MPSNAWTRWNGERSVALDEIEGAHASVGGEGPGRRFATLHINYAYAALLSGHFQGFCRELHAECADHIVLAVPIGLRAMLRDGLFWNRTLDRGNPHPGAIGTDFSRLSIDFWN